MLTFLGLSVLLILTPGPNQALLTSRVLSGGRAAGFAVVRGLACGMAVHVGAAIVGLSALLASSAELFSAVKLAGGVYLVFLGVSAILRSRQPAEAAPPKAGGSPFRDGLLSMSLNPKAAVFFVAVVPQFVAPGPGAATRVALLLLAYGALCLVFWSGFVLVLLRARELVSRPRVRAWMERLTGGALIGLGARLAAGAR
ncbi:MAG TPA: LysE family translocator [Solirubrobacteraceae bacterium]|nr:LysE family translocator [Solirubrobacteraceae bacterium]